MIKLSRSKKNILTVFFFICSLAFFNQSILAQSKNDFIGTWDGQISNFPFILTIRESPNKFMIATFFILNRNEDLEVLGWKETVVNQRPYFILYLFRSSDVACISLFFENGAMNFAYFEKDAVRKSILTKRTAITDLSENKNFFEQSEVLGFLHNSTKIKNILY